MTPDEKDFLIEEFKVNWAHLNLIEERRYKLFQYYSAFLGASVAASAGIFKLGNSNDVKIDDFALIFISFLLIILSGFCIKILKHERKANERYRDRINAIRSIFLLNSKDPQIIKLIEPKESQGYIETSPCPKKDLLLSDIFYPKKHNTALLFVSFMYMGIIFGILGIYFFAIRILFT